MSRSRGQLTILGAAVVASIVFVMFWIAVFLAPEPPTIIDKALGPFSIVAWIFVFLMALFNT